MSDDLAERLLAAQISFTMHELLDPQSYGKFVVDEVDAFLDDAARLGLDDVVTRDLIKVTAHKYTVGLPVEGSIPELVGEIAARLHQHRLNDELAMSEVLDSRHVDALFTAVSETGIARRIVAEIATSPAVVDACVDAVSHAFDAAVAEGRAPADNRGLRTSALRGITRLSMPVVPAVSAALALVTRKGAGYVLAAAKEDGDAVLLDAARDLWRLRSADSVGWFRELVTGEDIEDLVVVIFEFWKSFRDTDYFRALLDEGIDHVFDKYGGVSLVELLADLGIGRADLIEEGLRFGPAVMTRLDERGMLEPIIRRWLEPFYRSEEFREALDIA
ncbi:hypothetical protein ACPXB3_15095 [Gordonia sp. DT219]|uniref:hypothetical protein n=1 Tax=Gordonia sp. DT219 TaxID=3416658 RepID=UPI003CEC7142